jgi:hypothetical protein
MGNAPRVRERVLLAVNGLMGPIGAPSGFSRLTRCSDGISRIACSTVQLPYHILHRDSSPITYCNYPITYCNYPITYCTGILALSPIAITLSHIAITLSHIAPVQGDQSVLYVLGMASEAHSNDELCIAQDRRSRFAKAAISFKIRCRTF